MSHPHDHEPYFLNLAINSCAAQRKKLFQTKNEAKEQTHSPIPLPKEKQFWEKQDLLHVIEGSICASFMSMALPYPLDVVRTRHNNFMGRRLISPTRRDISFVFIFRTHRLFSAFAFACPFALLQKITSICSFNFHSFFLPPSP